MENKRINRRVRISKVLSNSWIALLGILLFAVICLKLQYLITDNYKVTFKLPMYQKIINVDEVYIENQNPNVSIMTASSLCYVNIDYSDNKIKAVAITLLQTIINYLDYFYFILVAILLTKVYLSAAWLDKGVNLEERNSKYRIFTKKTEKQLQWIGLGFLILPFIHIGWRYWEYFTAKNCIALQDYDIDILYLFDISIIGIYMLASFICCCVTLILKQGVNLQQDSDLTI